MAAALRKNGRNKTAKISIFLQTEREKRCGKTHEKMERYSGDGTGVSLTREVEEEVIIKNKSSFLEVSGNTMSMLFVVLCKL